jgi:acyl-CoA synthetase (AMP-forming)/AMP-acid ligase II
MKRSTSGLLNERTFVDLLRSQVAGEPERRCFTFLKEGAWDEVHLTAADLDRRARAIAARLQELGVTGGRAFLFHPFGPDYVAALFGCFYAGVTAVPAYPPRANRSIERLHLLAGAADASVILTTSVVAASGPRSHAETTALRSLEWVATDLVPDHEATAWRPPRLDGSAPALLQFTSGSTEQPRGVMLSHANLLHNSALIARAFGHTTDSLGVVWLPPFHDMGLVGGILQPVYAGFTGVLLSPVDFVRRPIRWLQAITRYGAVTSGGPNFAYDLCTRSITPEQRAGLDLSSWQVAFTGAEPIRAATLERFAEAFEPYGFRREAFYPCYGLAEATLIVSGGARRAGPRMLSVRATALEHHVVEPATVDDPDSSCRTLVGCGPPLASVGVRIVDPTTGVPCRPGRVGEVLVSGPSIAQGYWQRPDESESTFRAHPEGGAEAYLRTGDLGFLHEGELFITGRIKELIIVRGRNHYPQDIERLAEASHAAIRPGHVAVFAVPGSDGAEERVALVAEAQRGVTAAVVGEVAASVRRSVAEALGLEVAEVVLIRSNTLPRTSSGKIQRAACRAALVSGELDIVGVWKQHNSERAGAEHAPRTLVESQLTAICARVLGREQVGVRDNFFELGGASIQVVQVLDAAAQVGIQLTPEMFFEHQTIAELATALARNDARGARAA